MSLELEFAYINKCTGRHIAIGGQKLACADQDGHPIPIPPAIRMGAATCLIDPGNEMWHMELLKRHPTEHDLLESYTEGAKP